MKEQLEKLIRDLEGAIYDAGIEQAWRTRSSLCTIKNELQKQIENLN